MESCVNCACQLDDPYGNDNNDEDLKVFNVYGPLSSIYKLNYLSSLLDSSTFNNENTQIWKLCENCLETFNNLHQFYEDFNQLRSLESKLANEIQKLDDFVHTYQDQQHEQMQLKLQTEQHQYEENERKGERKKSISLHPSPIVVLQRLENDPVAQKFLIQSNSVSTEGVKRTRRSKRRTIKKVKFNDVSLSKSKVANNHNLESKGQTREIGYESGDDMDFFNDGANDPFFVPSPNPQSDQEEEEIDDDDDEYIPETKKQKEDKIKKIMETKAKTAELEIIEKYKIGKRIIPPDDPELKERKKFRKSFKYSYNYKNRKLKVPNPCWECELDFPSPAECYDHTMREHYQPGEHVCPNCSKIYSKIHSFTEHKEKECLSLRPGEILPELKCEKCEQQGKDITFSRTETYQIHLKQMHNDQLLECEFPGCDFNTTIPHRFSNHTRGHTNPVPIEERTCPECGQVFKYKVHCKSHYENKHTAEGIAKYQEELKRLNERRRQRNKEKQTVKETFCSECFGVNITRRMVDMLTPFALILHQKSTHGDPLSNFVCEECGKGFRNKGGLTRHKEHVHIAERRFCCESCGKSFKAKTTLNTHIRIAHSEEGRLEYNASMRVQNQRRKIRREALAQRLSAGIPTLTDSNNGNSNNNTNSNVVDTDSNSGNTNNTSNSNDVVDTDANELNLLLQQNFDA